MYVIKSSLWAFFLVTCVFKWPFSLSRCCQWNIFPQVNIQKVYKSVCLNFSLCFQIPAIPNRKPVDTVWKISPPKTIWVLRRSRCVVSRAVDTCTNSLRWSEGGRRLNSGVASVHSCKWLTSAWPFLRDKQKHLWPRRPVSCSHSDTREMQRSTSQTEEQGDIPGLKNGNYPWH